MNVTLSNFQGHYTESDLLYCAASVLDADTGLNYRVLLRCRTLHQCYPHRCKSELQISETQSTQQRYGWCSGLGIYTSPHFHTDVTLLVQKPVPRKHIASRKAAELVSNMIFLLMKKYSAQTPSYNNFSHNIRESISRRIDKHSNTNDLIHNPTPRKIFAIASSRIVPVNWFRNLAFTHTIVTECMRSLLLKTIF